MNLYLVRHPRPQGMVGRCYGRRNVGVGADALAEALAALCAHAEAPALRDAALFSSPAARCVALARAFGAPREPKLADALLELDFGSWEGLAWDEVPREQLDAWAADVWNYRVGGAESAAMVADRWLRWLEEVTRSGIGTAVAVTHAGVIRVARLCCGSLDAATFAQAHIGYGSVHRIDPQARRLSGYCA
jgi:alpha-ribazole phosphatase